LLNFGLTGLNTMPECYFNYKIKDMDLKNKCFRVIVMSLMFTLSCAMLSAQTKGIVLDEKQNRPLDGVNIYLTNNAVLAVTNNRGEFNLKKLSAIGKTDTVYFSYVGYAPKKITVAELKAKNYIVYLSETAQQLNEVTVVSNAENLKNTIDYKQLASLKDGLYAFGSLLINNKIYVIAGNTSFGSNSGLEALEKYGDDFLQHMKPTISWREYSGAMHIYDIETDKWTADNQKFSKRAYHDMHYFNGKIYILGGKTLSRDAATEYLDDKFEVYDLSKKTLLVDHTNPHQAINCASFTYNGSLIVMGGSTRLKSNGDKEYSNKVHLCDLKSGYWYELDKMPDAKETKGVIIGNTIYLIGGYMSRPLAEIQSYNVTTAQWSKEGELPYEVDRPGITNNGNLIYIFEDGKIQTYNIETKESNTYLIDLNLKSPELFCNKNKLYIVGGFQLDNSSVSPSSDLYSIDLDEFNKTRTLNK